MPRRRAKRGFFGMRWIEEGVKVRFDPFDYIQSFGSSDVRGREVTGTVVYVNKAHKWFSVEYGDGLRTSFKFTEVGQVVTICG